MFWKEYGEKAFLSEMVDIFLAKIFGERERDVCICNKWASFIWMWRPLDVELDIC